MYRIKELCNKLVPDVSIIFILFIFIIAGLFHYIFYHTEIEMYEKSFKDARYEYDENLWRIIEDSIINTNNKAKSKGLHLSQKLVNKILNGTDLNNTKILLDNGNYAKSGILVDIYKTINKEYLFDNKSDNNSVFVLYRDLYIDNKFDHDGYIYENKQSFIDSHYNPELTKQAIDRLIFGKGNSLIYFEDCSNSDIKTYTKIMDIQSLKNVINENGIEALKFYTILIPAYITEDGDIFGTIDITLEGTSSNNHKMILVQKYNLYDAVTILHSNDITRLNADHEKVISDVTNLLTFTHITYLAIMLMDMLVILIVLVYVSKTKKKTE